MTNIFKPDLDKYNGVRPVSIYVLRVFFVLMFARVGYLSWLHIFSHKDSWEPYNSVTWCVWAAYATLSFIGIYNTLKMLPIMLFMIFYKMLWLIVVAYPLWNSNTLIGSPHQEFTFNFIWVIVPALFFPWKYFYNNFIKPTIK